MRLAPRLAWVKAARQVTDLGGSTPPRPSTRALIRLSSRTIVRWLEKRRQCLHADTLRLICQDKVHLVLSRDCHVFPFKSPALPGRYSSAHGRTSFVSSILKGLPAPPFRGARAPIAPTLRHGRLSPYPPDGGRRRARWWGDGTCEVCRSDRCALTAATVLAALKIEMGRTGPRPDVLRFPTAFSYRPVRPSDSPVGGAISCGIPPATKNICAADSA
jgi:hypothetical protein